MSNSLAGSLVVGTTPGPIAATLQSVTLGSASAPVALDLSGATVTLKVRDPGGADTTIGAAIASAVSGQVTAAIPSGLLTLPGTYTAMFLITTADGQTVASPPFQWSAVAQPF